MDRVCRDQMLQAHDLNYRRARCRGKSIDQAIQAIDRLAGDVRAGKCETILAGGSTLAASGILQKFSLWVWGKAFIAAAPDHLPGQHGV